KADGKLMRDTGLTRFESIKTGIIDSHAHILKEFFPEDKEQVIENLKKVNVTHVINPGVDLEDIPELLRLADSENNIYLAIGLHPHQASEWEQTSAQRIEQYIEHPKVVAVGECGLDFYYNNSPRDQQLFAFREQIKIAAKFDKPVIVHC